MHSSNQTRKQNPATGAARSATLAKHPSKAEATPINSWQPPQMVHVILITALLAFETFNFDTTRHALSDFLGDTRFWGIAWAGILAFAFCAIDFAGLVRIFTPETGKDEPNEVWYLTGAWLLGATLNAVMTWWAVTITLLEHNFGNEVLNREILLRAVPIFVAVLVWLTRILFIGALTVTGDRWWRSQQLGATKLPTVRSTEAVIGGSKPSGLGRVGGGSGSGNRPVRPPVPRPAPLQAKPQRGRRPTPPRPRPR